MFVQYKTMAAYAIMCAVGIVGTAEAGDYYTAVPFTPTLKIGGTGATPVDETFGKEYSHTDWFSVYLSPADPRFVNFEDHDAFATPDFTQVVSWDGSPGPIGGNSGSVDAFDFAVTFGTREIDALAHQSDLLFDQVVDGSATLLFSVTADLDTTSVLPMPPSSGTPVPVAKDHVHWEDPTGAHATWAEIEAAPAGPGIGPGVNHHVVEDLDALEVWGPEPPSHIGGATPVDEGYVGTSNTADGNRFSMDMDSATGTSVFAFDISTKVVTPYISHATIVAAVEKLFNGDLPYDTDTRNLIDVDGTMVQDRGVVGEWDTGDRLLFTIDPLDSPMLVTGGLAAAVDGGEIMVLENLGGGALGISFLFHGGHLWDTAFDVSGTFGYFYEDVDALEAVGTFDGDDFSIPEPASAMLLALGAAVLLRRRNC